MTTQVKRDGSDDHHRRKTAPVENYPTPMNTVDTERLEQLRTIGVPFAGATNDDIRVFDCRILLEWATSLTNEAELRGRDSEQNRLFAVMRALHIKHDAKAIMRLRREWDETALLAQHSGVSRASSRINPSVRTEDNHQEGGA